MALVVLCLGVLMIILDTTIVNAALPSIQADLRIDRTDLAWVINAYLIAFGGLLLLVGRLGDLLGRARMFLAGLVLFTGASLLCGLAQSEPLLLAARFIQGASGAMTSAVVLGMVVTLFPEPAERARAIGVYSFFQAAGGSLGLLIGGAVTQAINWHWIFFVNVPIGVLTALAAAAVLERDHGLGLRQGADVPGAVLLVAALMLAVFAIVGVDAHGWTSAQTLSLAALAALLLGAFVRRESSAAAPIVPLRLVRSRNVSAANAVLALVVAAMFTMQFLVPLYLRDMLGYDPIRIGLAFVPLPLAIAVMSLGVTGRLIGRFGAAQTALPGLGLLALGLGLLAATPHDGVYLRDVLPAMLVLGVGAGLVIPSLMATAMADSSPADAGLASGLANTTIQVGGALGLAALVTISSQRIATLQHSGQATSSALLGGYHLAFELASGLALAALLVAVILLWRPWRSVNRELAQAHAGR